MNVNLNKTYVSKKETIPLLFDNKEWKVEYWTEPIYFNKMNDRYKDAKSPQKGTDRNFDGFLSEHVGLNPFLLCFCCCLFVNIHF